MDPNNNQNRLHLNFGFNERQFTPNSNNNRAYPTTPSTFPQPMYGPPGGQEYVEGGQSAQNVYNQGYFMNSPYAPQQSPQQPQYGHPSLQSPQPAYQSRVGGYQANDGTNGLVQQFSNQDLSGAPRNGMYGRNAPPPGQRPRTAGSPAGNQVPSHLAPPMPATRSPKPAGEEEELVRYPERYSENVHKRGRAAKELVNVFFRENIERARDRNMR